MLLRKLSIAQAKCRPQILSILGTLTFVFWSRITVTLVLCIIMSPLTSLSHLLFDSLGKKECNKMLTHFLCYLLWGNGNIVIQSSVNTVQLFVECFTVYIWYKTFCEWYIFGGWECTVSWMIIINKIHYQSNMRQYFYQQTIERYFSSTETIDNKGEREGRTDG